MPHAWLSCFGPCEPSLTRLPPATSNAATPSVKAVGAKPSTNLLQDLGARRREPPTGRPTWRLLDEAGGKQLAPPEPHEGR